MRAIHAATAEPGGDTLVQDATQTHKPQRVSQRGHR